jgi:GAF domain-containing protein
MKRRAWLLYVSGGLTALLAFLFVSDLRHGWFFNLLAVSSPVAIVLAVRMWKPEPRGAWYLFALGQALFVAGDVITYNYDRFFGTELPFPSVGDVLYLSVYPCLVAGILILVRRRSPGRDRESLIDSLIIAIGVGVISWVFLMAPTAKDTDSTLLQKIVSMGYPFMDLVLLTVIVRLVIGPGRRGLSFYLMPVAALSLFLTDFVYSYISVQGLVYDQSGYLEAGWGLFYLLWGAAALHESQRHLGGRAPEQDLRITRRRLVLVGTAALIPQCVRAIQLLRDQATDLWVITISTTCLFILVAVRMSGLVRKLELSFGRENALRTAGASFVTATNREGIYAAVMEAVSALAAPGHSRLLVETESSASGSFTVAATSDIRSSLVGKVVDLPEPYLASLRRHRAGRGPMPELVDRLALPTATMSVLAIPLFVRGRLNALLIVGSEKPLAKSTADGLQALSSQVALALESAALTEDLVRQKSEARFAS